MTAISDHCVYILISVDWYDVLLMTLQNPQNTAFSYDRTRISVVDISADYYYKKNRKQLQLSNQCRISCTKLGYYINSKKNPSNDEISHKFSLSTGKCLIKLFK